MNLEKESSQQSSQHVESAISNPDIDQGNAAVLLDVNAAHVDGSHSGLRLAKDGHVRDSFMTCLNDDGDLTIHTDCISAPAN